MYFCFSCSGTFWGCRSHHYITHRVTHSIPSLQKINQKLKSNPDIYPTLQSIVLHEVETEVSQVRNSATEALLWLRRGLKFLKEFLSEVNAGQQDIQEALSKWRHCGALPASRAWNVSFSHVTSVLLRADAAYGRTLRQYHGWVVRGVFAVSISLSSDHFFKSVFHCKAL